MVDPTIDINFVCSFHLWLDQDQDLDQELDQELDQDQDQDLDLDQDQGLVFGYQTEFLCILFIHDSKT